MQTERDISVSLQTASSLIRVYNDILTAIDNRRKVILLLPNLSAVFDTVDHDIFLSRFQERFGVTGFKRICPIPCSMCPLMVGLP